MRSFLNEPLSAYIARQRVERAVMYMQTEEMTLAALAEKVGYDNSQSFSKAFKKQFGISPISVHFEYTLRHGMAFEEYLNSPHDTKEDDLLTKIYIPIR
jgi:AraC-like DNA-binding protein